MHEGRTIQFPPNKLLLGIPIILAILAGCSGSATQTGSVFSATPGSEKAELPALPLQPAKLKDVAALDHYTFSETDCVSSSDAQMSGTALHVGGTASLSYAVLGVQTGGAMPQQLTVTGSFHNLYIGIPDYAHGVWIMYGRDLLVPLTMDLPQENILSPDGSFYVALICDANAEAQITVSVSLPVSTEGSWNLLVWFAGDNNLADAAFDDLQEMEAIGSTEDIRLLAGYDIDPSWFEQPPAGTDAVYFIKVVQDTDAAAVNVSGDPANASFPRAGYNSADPEHVREFVDWANTNFPADHTALVLWNHGSGWCVNSESQSKGGRRDKHNPAHPPRPPRQTSGVLGDDTDGSYDLTSNAAIAGALAEYSFDMILFDACVMSQVESLYDYHAITRWAVASEVLVPNDGYPYDSVLSQWHAGFPLGADSIGQLFVDQTISHYTQTGEYVDHALIDIDALEALVTSLADCTDAITLAADTEQSAFQGSVIGAYEPFGSEGSRDLRDFLQQYREASGNTGIQCRIDSILPQLDACVVHHAEFEEPRTTGISIWLPDSWYFSDEYQAAYDTLAFDDATGWLAMLQAIGVPGGGGDWPVYTDWTAGDQIVVSWDNPELLLDPVVYDPNWNWGSPGAGEDLAGEVEFSQDSSQSGTAEEWARLLATAPFGSYSMDLEYSDPEGPNQVTVHLVQLDEAGVLKQDFGELTVYYDYYQPVLVLNYINPDLPQADWIAGDRIELSWLDPFADFDLEIVDPQGYYGAPYWPDELFGEIEFSLDSYESGVTLEWGTLLAGAPVGKYTISVTYASYDWYYDPPPLLMASLALYDVNGVLKQDLGELMFDGYEPYTTQTAAVLTLK